MKRSASLDFLRGAAAFAVAVPHYLTANAPFSPGAESVAVAAVEVFFVLSGFVLAPQIVDWVVGRPWRNLGVFLARRWMRTIPPYVAALVVVAVMTGHLFTADTLRYLFYVENLFRSANAVDFYPVAWSLAVEEWFYLLFAPLLFLLGRALGRSDRRLDVAFAILFVLAIAALRAVLRAAGLGPERAAGDALPHRFDRLGLPALSGAGAAAASSTPKSVQGSPRAPRARRRASPPRPRSRSASRCWRSRAPSPRSGSSRTRRRCSALAAVGVLPRGGRTVQGTADRGAELLSRPHLVLGLPVPHRHRHGAEARSSADGRSRRSSRSTSPPSAPFRAFSGEVSSGRCWRRGRTTTGGASSRRVLPETAPERSPPGGGGRLRAAGLGLRLPRRRRSRAQRLHGERALSVLSGAGRRGRARACARRSAPGGSRPACEIAARALLLFALALPAADAVYRSTTGVPIAGSVANPTYSFGRRARTRPRSPCGGSTTSTNGSATTASAASSRSPTRRRSSRSCSRLEPGAACSTPPSGSMSAGFRGPEIAAEKGDRFQDRRPRRIRRRSGRPCATEKSRGPSGCRISSAAPRAAGRSR